MTKGDWNEDRKFVMAALTRIEEDLKSFKAQSHLDYKELSLANTEQKITVAKLVAGVSFVVSVAVTVIASFVWNLFVKEN